MRRRGGWAGMMRFVLIFLTVFFFSAAESDAFVATPGNATDGGYDREEGEGTETSGNGEVPDEAEDPDDAEEPDDVEEPDDAGEPGDAEEPDDAGEPGDVEEPDDAEVPDDTEVPEIPEDPQIPNDLGTPDNPEPSPPAILPAERATPPEAARVVGAVLLLEPEDDVAEISQGDQLIQWMEEHKRAGGKAVLTQDVRIDSPYRYSYVRGGKPVEIDTGGYTLIIEDYVYLEGFSNLTIHGTGGSGDALIRVAPGGSLILAYSTIYADEGAEGIYTIWQEDGSTLYIDQSEFTKVDGPIHYSGVMTGTLYEDAVMGYVALPGNSEIEEGILPQSIRVLLYPNDGVESQILYEAPIVWDLEQAREEQADHIRVGVRGRVDLSGYPGMEIPDVLEYWLCFQTKEAIFLDVTKNMSPDPEHGAVQVLAHLSVTRNFDRTFFMWSKDGENWEKEEVNSYDDLNGRQMVGYTLSDDEDYYICVEFLDGEDKYYSNVLLTREDALVEAEDYEGGRGGGTDIVGNEPPPVTEKPPQNEPDPGDPPDQDSGGDPSGERPGHVLPGNSGEHGSGGDGSGGDTETSVGGGNAAAPEGTIVTPEGPAVTPEGPVVTPEGSVASPEGPVASQEGSAVMPDEPVLYPNVIPDNPGTAQDPQFGAQPPHLHPGKDEAEPVSLKEVLSGTESTGSTETEGTASGKEQGAASPETTQRAEKTAAQETNRGFSGMPPAAQVAAGICVTLAVGGGTAYVAVSGGLGALKSVLRRLLDLLRLRK